MSDTTYTYQSVSLPPSFISLWTVTALQSVHSSLSHSQLSIPTTLLSFHSKRGMPGTSQTESITVYVYYYL